MIMPSPFPGMDPFLEGYLWPDVHHNLASVFQQLLTPQIIPKYVARVNLYTVQDSAFEEDLGILYPDVELLLRDKAEEPEAAYAKEENDQLTPPDHRLFILEPIEVRIPVLEIRDKEKNRLITAIEILSPVNKRHPGLEPYRAKYLKLNQAGVHLLEVDLLRRGERPFRHPNLPEVDYRVTLTRGNRKKIDVWDLAVKDNLPTVPVPLREGDGEVILNLGQALSIIYDRNQYQLTIDYQKDPPPPAFSQEDTIWIRKVLNDQDQARNTKAAQPE